MSFGFRSLNNNNYVQIDTETPRICVLDQGSYISDSSTAYGTFNKVITTSEPPLIFIHPTDSSNFNRPYYRMNFQGSSGNWTGFNIEAGNVQDRPTGKFFVGQWQVMNTATGFGMRIWNADSSLLYDSGAPSVNVTFASGDWTYLGYIQYPDYGGRTTWAISHNLAANEYMMMNPFAVGFTNAVGGNVAAITADYTNNRILLTTTSTSAWLEVGHRALVCAKIVV